MILDAQCAVVIGRKSGYGRARLCRWKATEVVEAARSVYDLIDNP